MVPARQCCMLLRALCPNQTFCHPSKEPMGMFWFCSFEICRKKLCCYTHNGQFWDKILWSVQQKNLQNTPFPPTEPLTRSLNGVVCSVRRAQLPHTALMLPWRRRIVACQVLFIYSIFFAVYPVAGGVCWLWSSSTSSTWSWELSSLLV